MTCVFKNQGRETSIDLTRGLIMVLMLIDHASLFIAQKHPSEYWGLPLPQYIDGAWFWLRFLSHFCAPGFFFLMGMSLFLFKSSREQKGMSKFSISKYLIMRGIILVLCEQIVANPAWILAPHIEQVIPGTGTSVMLHLGVLFSLGVSMILGAFFMWLPTFMLWLLGIVAVCLPLLMVPDASFVENSISPLWRLMAVSGQTGVMVVLYPIFPWFGVTIFGIILAKSYEKDVVNTFKKCVFMAGVSLCLFFVLRLLNWGDFHLVQAGIIGFFNVTKYPASLAFISIFLAGVLFVLYFFHKIKDDAYQWRVLSAFGRSALFFYFVHLYLLLFLGYIFPKTSSFLAISLACIVSLGILYPLCLKFEAFKRAKPASSWLRMF